MRRSFMFLPGLVLAWASAAAAQDTPAAPEAKGRGLSVVGAPIPISDPAIGNGLGVVGLALYRADGSTRPWSSSTSSGACAA